MCYNKIGSNRRKGELSVSDFSTGSGIPFEYTVAEQQNKSLTLRRIALIAFYILWSVACVLIGLLAKEPLLAVALLAISLWPIISFSWRYTRIEYEYSFFGGTLTVSRILGSRSRRVLCEVAIKKLEAVYPCEEEYIARAEQFGASKTIMAASSVDAETLCVALWTDENDTKYALYFEPNERAVRIMKNENYTATTALKK